MLNIRCTCRIYFQLVFVFNLVFTSVLAEGGDNQSVTITMPVGSIKGKVISKGNVAVSVFKGVPYAEPPVGDLRWRPSEMVNRWVDVKKAYNEPPACLQPENPNRKSIFYRSKQYMDENCLFLNIWTPYLPVSSSKLSNKNIDAALPVMVWIHGGGFLAGSSSMSVFEGRRLAEKGVVVVSLNYRVGIFGFFSHPSLSLESEHDTSGNYGLHDQILALKFIRENIHVFGGNPENITIFGESSGAVSIFHLLTSPLADGLFHKAIAQSPGLQPIPKLNANHYGKLSAEQTGYEFGLSIGKKTLGSLRSMSAESLLSAATTAGYFPETVEDGWLVPCQLIDCIESGRQHDIPLVAGFNRDEGSYFKDYIGLYAAYKPASREHYKQAVKNKYGQLSEEYLAVYPSTDLEGAVFSPIRDAVFGWPAEKFSAEVARKGKSPAYLYYFEHKFSWADKLELGVFHSSEIPFVFNNVKDSVKYSPSWPDYIPRPSDIEMADIISDYWVAFARDGRPSVKHLPGWPAYSLSDQGYMSFRAGSAEPKRNLLPGMLELHEKIVDFRRSRNEVWWPHNIGLMAPDITTD